MKIANRILNILVLLLALGAATGSFFLFQKREQITKGRQMMSEAVVKTVKTIDPAAKISVEEMSIAKPAADLAAPLKVLEDNTKKIVDQRNKIAAAVAEISNAYKIPGTHMSQFRHRDFWSLHFAPSVGRIGAAI